MSSYTYDHRPRKAAHDKHEDEGKDGDKDDTLETLVGLLDDAVKLAEDLVSELDKSTDTDLSDPMKHAQAALDDLRTCDSVETLKDFIANISEASKNVGLLEPALKKAKKDAKAQGDDAAIEAVDEAIDALKSLKRELSDVEDEIEEAQSKS